MERPLITFGVEGNPDMTDSDYERLFLHCQKANDAIMDLQRGELSLTDAIDLCESFGCDADDVILTLTTELNSLGFY